MDELETKRADLERELHGADPNVGIAFGVDLFEEFRQRGWFTLETFGALGTSLFSTQVPTFDKTHFVFPSWGIPANEFQVGRAQQ